MSFMSSYKSLDNLCRSFSDYPDGISSYIKLMESTCVVARSRKDWQTDYEILKRYRHLRNRIVHENGVFEENVTSLHDEEWLEGFSRRILEQTDPLAVYFKSERESAQASIKAVKQKSLSCALNKRTIICGILVAVISVAIVALVALLTKV